MIVLLEAAHGLHRFVTAQGWRYCFIGGFALQHWGEPRLTLDIVLTLLAEFGDEARYVDVLLLRSPAAVDIDIALGALPFEVSAVARSLEVELLPGREVRLCSPEDLIVFKAFADRPRDWLDIETVITRQGATALDWTYIDEMLGELAALKEQPELLARLHQLRGPLAGG